LPKNHFKDVKKVADFPYVRREEGWSTNIWKIAYVFCRYFLKASLREVLNQKKSVKFHTLGGGQDKFGSFSLFFLLVLSHANMKRKVFFVGVVKFHTYFFYFD